MNTEEIKLFLNSDTACRRVFQCVFSSDMLPQNPRLLVCNTDPSTKPGQHWIAIHVDENGCGEYFDSFGQSPNKVFEDYMNKYSCKWIFNNRPLQSIISNFCGVYCCFYCMFRCRGIDLPGVVRMFTKDTGFNDSIVHSFVCNKVF
jgi:hypothetical protein